MIKLGCNYSKELTQLIREKRVEVDYIKLALIKMYEDGLEEARSLRPVLLHGVTRMSGENASMKTVDLINWKQVNYDIQLFKSPHIALHFASMPINWENPDEVSDFEIIERIKKVILTWKANVSVPMLIENLPYYPVYGPKCTFLCTTEPKVINIFCNELDIGLLLDLAHARVAAWHRGEDVYDYLAGMPLERVKEIHVSGPIMDPEGGLRDRHLEMSEIDFKLLKWLLKRTSPDVVTLEYGGPGEHFAWRTDINVIESHLVKLRDVLNS